MKIPVKTFNGTKDKRKLALLKDGLRDPQWFLCMVAKANLRSRHRAHTGPDASLHYHSCIHQEALNGRSADCRGGVCAPDTQILPLATFLL